MRHICFLIAALLFVSSGVFAQNADKIIAASRDRIKADTIQSQSKMLITSKNGGTSERTLNQYSKDGPNGTRIIVEFLSPASVKGTRFLTMQNPSGGDDRWIYLPELNRVRRVAAQEGAKSFVGTDLSYDDVSSADRETDKDAHKVLREEKVNGKLCYVIESVPKDTSYQYSKMVSWIDKENYVNYKMELHDKKGALVKRYEILELKEVQGRLSPWVARMTTVKTNTSTKITMLQLAYDKAIPESAFTTNYLETGKAN